MEENTEHSEINNKMTRPVFLIVISILSWVSIGLTLLGNIFQVIVTGPASEESILAQKVEFTKMITQFKEMNSDFGVTMFQKMIVMTENLNTHFYAYNLTSIAFLTIGLFGVIKMWQGKKIGFHLYIVYSLLMTVQMYFFVSPSYIPTFLIIWNIIISGIFVFMYSRNLKWMK